MSDLTGWFNWATDKFPTWESLPIMEDDITKVAKQLAHSIQQQKEELILGLMTGQEPNFSEKPTTTYETYKKTYKLDIDKLENSMPATKTYLSSNSTTTPLCREQIFTGMAEDVSIYDVLVLCVFSDAPSVEAGCQLDWSNDGINWMISNKYTIVPANPFITNVPVVGKYVRVRYENGPIVQGVFYIRVEGWKSSKLQQTTTQPRSRKEIPIDELGGTRKYNFEEDQ